MSWKLTAFAPRIAVETALARQEADPDWDHDLVVTGFEVADERPDEWQLDAYCPRKPRKQQLQAILDLFDDPPPLAIEKLPQADWVSESQRGVDPIRAGRFRVRTPEHPAHGERGITEFCIPAAQAFGTGQHATTAGCLAMLDAMKRQGLVVRNLADIGTGTGLLAFAALALWPRAFAIGSDIDPVCLPAVIGNAQGNAVPLGNARGELAMVLAEGMDHPLLEARAPYDLVIANILAGPLIDLAPAFAAAVGPRGSILLAGLLETQERAVRSAYLRQSFRLQARIVRGDWSILWLRGRFHG